MIFQVVPGVPSPFTLRCFPWIVEHATDILNKCHVASGGKSAYDRLKKRPHRGELLPFGTAVMFTVAGKVPGGVMTERWASGNVAGTNVSTQKNTLWHERETAL